MCKYEINTFKQNQLWYYIYNYEIVFVNKNAKKISLYARSRQYIEK